MILYYSVLCYIILYYYMYCTYLNFLTYISYNSHLGGVIQCSGRPKDNPSCTNWFGMFHYTDNDSKIESLISYLLCYPAVH